MTTITVAAINVKMVETKYGSKPTYTIQGTDGQKYNCGFKKPPVNEGETFEASTTAGKYGHEVYVGSIKKTSAIAMPTTATPPAATRSYGPPAKVFPIPPLHGDRAIVRQNSLTNAVNLLREDKDINKLAPTDRADVLIMIARRFEAYSCGDLDMEAAMQDVAKEEVL